MKTPNVKAFVDKVQKQYTVLNDMGNPFMEETGDLFTLDTKMIAHPSVAEMVASRYDHGKTRFSEFLKGLDLSTNQEEQDRFLSAKARTKCR